VEEPNESAGIDFSIERSGTISGKVTDTSGRPFGKAVITALGINMGDVFQLDSAFSGPFGKYQQTVYPDSNGVYAIEGLRKGPYFVFASVMMEWESMELWYDQGASMQEADSVMVRAGENTSGIDFTFPKTAGYGSISGMVTDKTGKPLAGAGVSILKDGGSWGNSRFYRYAVTDSAGQYSRISCRPVTIRFHATPGSAGSTHPDGGPTLKHPTEPGY